ncbi:egghead protein (zeste-white 4 protein), glycosyltransferase family 2 protein [Pseudohyphozyma bogoriensis]|nr:egghead protein (zeste-white 4 protein), glycosyltransferase family 2 protein [Pseudohyphozyma bogoriensis]
MFSSNPGNSTPAEHDQHEAIPRRPSPDFDASAADPLRTQYHDYDVDSPAGSRRESFMDSDLEMRKYQGLSHLSASGVQGYSAVGAGDQSEPGSPVQNEGYERSHESGSSGTKVDRPTNARPETMSSEGSYDQRDRSSALGGAHTSESGHAYNDVMMYGRHNGSGYDHADLYHPSSPSSNFGRYREGSFGHASGIESGRASTIGTDHSPSGLPHNSSRVALNNEWRNSYDQGSDIGRGMGMAISEVAPGKEGYGRPESNYGEDPEKSQGGQKYVPIPPSSPAVGISEKADFPNRARDPPEVVISRQNRLDWIDGLRGLASIVIFTHHFSDLTWSQSHPNTLADGSLQGFLKNGQLAVGMYFLLGGRVLAASFLKSAFTIPKAPVVHGDDEPEKPVKPAKPPGPRWLSLSSSLFRRSIRLAFPAIVIGFIQWKVCVDGLMETAIQAQDEVLSPSDLWVPTWCQIGNFAGFLQFVLDLFTERNHQYMLVVGSALWTTYDQFWGSVLVYIVAGTLAPLPFRGRYALYLAISVSLWWVNSPNMLYMLGLWLADLHAAGWIRKLQDGWKRTLGVEVCCMALALSFIAGGAKVATPANSAIASITVWEGKFGWDPTLVWPQYMLMSNWIPPACILLWVEVSHAMQWFVSWGIFTWIGKVSYGFYLMQFLTIYGLMPHLVLYFNAQGRSYWDIVVPTYIICLIFNFFIAWVAYHLLDRVGLKLGKYIWDGLFVTKPNTAGALPWKMVRATADLITHGPGRAIRSIGNKTTTTYHSSVEGLHTLFNWRSPTTRPAVPDPTDPEVLAQLHSTRWTSDLSGDPEAMRTRRLLKLQSWAWLPHLFLIPGLTAVWVIYHPTGAWTFDALTFSALWRFIWVLSLPNCLFAWFGFITPDTVHSKEVMDKRPVHREYIRNFFIVLVTKGSNESAVRRGYNKLLKLEKYHPAVKVVVLTDEPYVYPDLQNIVCPKSYKSPLGKAKYKARALDYFRYHVSLGVYDWILHMDEESVTDAESLRHCIEFIRYTPHHFGQGIILYNGEGYWENWYFTVADGIRVGDDLARFHFQNSVIHRPVFGVHGSFLMTNGEMENECTWDFGSLAEDFEFSQDAWRRGFTSGRIHGIVREQSPTTLRDFLKQRRRWFMGIRDIKGLYGLPHLAINLWIVGVFTLGVTIINLPLGFIEHSLTPIWIAVCADFCFICFFTLYLWGLLFQELDYGQPWYKIIVHILCAVVIQPFASVAEGLSAIWAMSSEDFGKFEVIVKR